MSKRVYVKLDADTSGFEKGMVKARKTFKKTAASLKATGKTMTMGLTAPLLAFAGASVKAFDTQAKAEAKLNTALKGNEKAFKSLKTQAQELQKVTIFGDEETMAAQSMLASMGLEADAIKELTPLIQDMATAKGMNLTAAADLVAKSVGSSTNALSRYGIQIKGEVGSTERLKSAVSALSGQFEGQSRAAAKAGAGGLKQLQNKFGDLMEQIGQKLVPILNMLVDGINVMIDKWNSLDEGLKIAIITFAGILAAIGPVLTIFGTLVSVVGFFLSPLGAVIALIAGLSAAAIYVADNLEVMGQIGKMVVVSLGNAFLNIGQMLITPFEALIDGFNKVMRLMGKEEFKNPFTSMKDGLEDLKGEVPEVSAEFGSFGDAVSNAALKAKSALFGVGSSIGVGGEVSAAQSGGGFTGGGESGGGSSEGGEGGDGSNPIVNTLITIKETATSVATSISESFAQSFTNLLMSGENLLQGLKGIFINLAKQFAAMIVQAAILAALMTVITGGSFAGVATKGGSNFASKFISGLTGKASGGAVMGGTPYMVGEKGPELFMPGQSGTIIPNNNLAGGQVIPEVVISGNDLKLVFDRTNEEQNGINS